MVPITTQNKKMNLPTHIEYEHIKINESEETKNVILCEQLQMKTVEELREFGKYCYFLPYSVMHKVDRALAVQLGIDRYW